MPWTFYSSHTRSCTRLWDFPLLTAANPPHPAKESSMHGEEMGERQKARVGETMQRERELTMARLYYIAFYVFNRHAYKEGIEQSEYPYVTRDECSEIHTGMYSSTC